VVSGGIPFIDADAVHAALDWQVLIDALRAAFRAGGNTPLRAATSDAGGRSAAPHAGVGCVEPRREDRDGVSAQPARGLASVSAFTC
jgi:hypothetical protein